MSFPNDHYDIDLPPYDRPSSPELPNRDEPCFLDMEHRERMEVVEEVTIQARNERGCYLGTKTPLMPSTGKPLPDHLQSVLSPRPFEDVFFERQYLMEQAGYQKGRLIQDLRLYARVEFGLIGLELGQERRRLRKKRALIRCRVDEGMRQNLMLCMRLLHVDFELRSREAMNILHNSPDSSVSSLLSASSGSSVGSTAASSTSAGSASDGAPTRVRTYKDSARDREARRKQGLNAMSPEFVPLNARAVMLAELKVMSKEEDEKRRIQEEEARQADERRQAEEGEERLLAEREAWNQELAGMDDDMIERRFCKRLLYSVPEEVYESYPPQDWRRITVRDKAWRNPLPY